MSLQNFGRRLDHLVNVLEGGRGGFSPPNTFEDVVRLTIPAMGSFRWREAAVGSVTGGVGVAAVTAFIAGSNALIYVPYAVIDHDDAVSRRATILIQSPLAGAPEVTVAVNNVLATNQHLIIERPILVPPGHTFFCRVDTIGAGNTLRIRWLQLTLALGEQTFSV